MELGEFDLVLCFGLLYHLENPMRTIRHLRALTGQGLLLESMSLRGICRAVGVGLRWLLQFLGEQFRRAPDHLYVKSPGRTSAVILQ